MNNNHQARRYAVGVGVAAGAVSDCRDARAGQRPHTHWMRCWASPRGT
jgi:hypothetical protein